MLPIALTYWPFLQTFLKNNKEYFVNKNCSKEELQKLISNFVSGSHALSIIIFGCIYLVTQSSNLFYFIFFFSIVYFIYDSYSIWFNKIKEYYPYFIHHGASIYFLQCLLNYEGDVKNTMILGYILLEITNLPSYYIYYYLKTNETKNEEYYKKLLNLKLGQLGLYFVLRLIVFGYLMKYCYKYICHQPVLTSCIVGLYIMGVYWSYKLIQGYLKTKEDYEKIKIKQ